ncbi:MAG: diguanylate cyclase [Candidatus Omnitrophica bacterium]|nr:diguanylate cyclase [Candidatus Omnitrophota bacterium]
MTSFYKNKYQERFKRLVSNFLNLGTDYEENISLLIRNCGELLKADTCFYNRIEENKILNVAVWRLPSTFKKVKCIKGYFCYDVVNKNLPGEAFIVKDLPSSSYYKTDPNVKACGFNTYIGFPVSYTNIGFSVNYTKKICGALCVAYKKNVNLTNEDIIIIELTANFIGVEEERRVINEQLYKRIEFEKLISHLSSRFINLSDTQTDKVINEALKEIGEFCQVDRSYIFLGYEHGRKVRNTHEWCAEGIEPLIDKLNEIEVKNFEWFAQKIKNKEVVYISNINQLPKEADALRKLLKSQGVLSILCVPLIYKGEVIGFLGFDAVRKSKEWSNMDIATLKLASESFASSLMQKRIQQKLIRTNIRLKELSFKDHLTGVYNQRYFQEVMEREFQRAKRQSLPLSILMIDLDYFKSINELYGFNFGDLILKQLAKRLKKLVRRYDIVIRYSGEEFIIITPAIDRMQTLNLGQRILDNIILYNFGNHKEKIKIKLSIAVVSYPEDRISKTKDFVELAEKLLLEAKERGGNILISSLDFQKKAKFLITKKNRLEKIDGLKKQIDRLIQKTNQNFMESIYAFVKTLEAKDQYSGEHVERTVYYAVEISKKLSLPPHEIEFIRQAAILHDLGKVGINENILCKKGKLTPSEFRHIKNHPIIAAEILRSVHFLQPVIPIILNHHERWDGRGYPHGLKRDEIPLGARILAVADVFQALISDRPYRKAYSFTDAVEIVKRGRATHFDPHIVDVFLEVLNKK